MSEERRLLVDASVFITLTDIGAVELLYGLAGTVTIPGPVRAEITDEPAKSELERATSEYDVVASPIDHQSKSHREPYERAATHLNQSVPMIGGEPAWPGDVALLAEALTNDDVVVVTDDKPLRKTCKALSIPVSGSIAVPVRAVERGVLSPTDAKAKLEAMDEVGARLSARLLRRAERLIDDAAPSNDG